MTTKVRADLREHDPGLHQWLPEIGREQVRDHEGQREAKKFTDAAAEKLDKKFCTLRPEDSFVQWTAQEPDVEHHMHHQERPTLEALILAEHVGRLGPELIDDGHDDIHESDEEEDQRHDVQLAELRPCEGVPRGDDDEQGSLHDLADNEQRLGGELKWAQPHTVRSVRRQVACVEQLGDELHHDDRGQRPDHSMYRPGVIPKGHRPPPEAQQECGEPQDHDDVCMQRPSELDAEFRAISLGGMDLHLELVVAPSQCLVAIRDGEIPDVRPDGLLEGAHINIAPLAELADPHAARSPRVLLPVAHVLRRLDEGPLLVHVRLDSELGAVQLLRPQLPDPALVLAPAQTKPELPEELPISSHVAGPLAPRRAELDHRLRQLREAVAVQSEPDQGRQPRVARAAWSSVQP
eukprot:CAMPEP_0170215458 /NCGR_PEP_ID=MMETSP0116_2-20130129/7365_1 /TAXON_ID=400756 /ORGANISM="Durinskia baltica, Strain CSIRO CS-38" /LENGTH=406 /DNA_ID=CAMNT_0010466033 /DNA_START=230 /DNA_END=1449 /DNA_ORIENTATION=-